MGWLTMKRNLNRVSVLLASVMMIFTSTVCMAQGVSIMQDGRVDHSVYDALLKKYVDKEGFVAYQKWKDQDEATLDGYLEAIGQVDPARLKNDGEKLVFWINVYNALTLKAMLHFYPTKSIRDHVKIIGYNIWKDYKLTIHDKDYSLDDMEHQILRKMNEPRIHFAIVCASIGCPPLLDEAFTTDRLERQLTERTITFFSDPDKFRIDPDKNTVRLSPIMDWYKDDFGKNQQDRLDFIKPFIQDADARAFLSRDKLKIENLDYDWGINDQMR